MNYFKKIAKEVLSLQWDDEKNESEEFYLMGHNNYRFKITTEGLAPINESIMLVDILKGTAIIQKIPWQPQSHEKCWVINPLTKNLHEHMTYDEWFDNDKHKYDNFLCVKTIEEAKEKAKIILELWRRYREGEIDF